MQLRRRDVLAVRQPLVYQALRHFGSDVPRCSSTNREDLTDALESRLRLRLAGRQRHGDHHTGLTRGSRAATRAASRKETSVPRIQLYATDSRLVRVAYLNTGARREVDRRAPLRLSQVTVAGSCTDSHQLMARVTINYTSEITRANE